MATTKTTAKASLGKGTTVELVGFGFVGQGTNISITQAGTVEPIEKTTFDSPEPGGNMERGGREYEFTRCGQPPIIALTLAFDQGQALPVMGDVYTVRMTWPLSKSHKTPLVFSGEGAYTDDGFDASVNGIYTRNVTIHGTGVWTWTMPEKKA